jgi:hypothetical protein
VLTYLIAIAACISFIKDGLGVELYGLPAMIFQKYVALRDVLFWPLVELLRYFGLPVPWWVKDAIVAYGLVAGALWRVVVARVPGAVREHGAEALLNALFWPYFFIDLWLEPWRMRIWQARNPPRNEEAARLYKHVLEQRQDGRRAAYRYGLFVLRQLLFIVAWVAAIFLASHLQNASGLGA